MFRQNTCRVNGNDILKTCAFPALFILIFLLVSCINKSDKTQKTEPDKSLTKSTVTTDPDHRSAEENEIKGRPETVTDIDGNEYQTISVGNQTWMLKNLKTTRFNDGSPIPLVPGEADWAALATSGYCWYDNEESSYKPMYGALYNGFAVLTGKLCPVGWHVPADIEWAALVKFLGGEHVAGAKLKEKGTTFWVSPNAGASNESGFTALPGGVRYHDGAFHDFGFSGYFWSSTEYYQNRAFFYYVDYQYTNVFRFDNLKKNGFSVRCIMDY